MATLERSLDRGTRLGRTALVRIGQELRDARLERGLTLRAAASAVGISPSELGRIERAEAPWVGIPTLARCAAVVGLDLSVRLYPGGHPFRDSSQLSLLAGLRAVLNPALAWAKEVPLPIAGDARAWDAAIAGRGWQFGVEAETAPRDLQALGRRIHLKLRDSRMDGALLLVRDTRLNRDLLRREAFLLSEEFPVPGRRVLRELAAGSRPSGSALIVLAARPLGAPRTRTKPGSRDASPPGQPCAAGRRRTTRSTVLPQVQAQVGPDSVVSARPAAQDGRE